MGLTLAVWTVSRSAPSTVSSIDGDRRTLLIGAARTEALSQQLLAHLALQVAFEVVEAADVRVPEVYVREAEVAGVEG